MTALEILKVFLVPRPSTREQRAAPPVEPPPTGDREMLWLGERVGELVGTAAHEAAHSIVCSVLGVQVISVVVHLDGSGSVHHAPARDAWDDALIALAGIEYEKATYLAGAELSADEPDLQRVRHLSRAQLAEMQWALCRFLADRRVCVALDELSALLILERELDGATVTRIVQASGARQAVGILRDATGRETRNLR